MWRHLRRLSLNPNNSVNALRKSSPFPRISEKAMGRTVFDGAWVTCLPMNQPLCPGRWRSLNGQAWVIHPPSGIGPTYMICPVRLGESPKENHGVLYRTWEGGDWPTVGVMVSRPMPPWSFSLCAFSGVFLSLCSIVGSEVELSLAQVVSTEKSGFQVYPTWLLDTPLLWDMKGPLRDHTAVLAPWACRQLTRPGLILPFGHQPPPLG